MTSAGDKPPKPTSSANTGKGTRTGKIRAGKRTARTSGISQSAFGGYAPPSLPPAQPSGNDAEEKEQSQDEKPSD